MVGHILEYHPAILELRRLVRNGELGRLQYIHSSRLQLGKLRDRGKYLWALLHMTFLQSCFYSKRRPFV